MSLDRGYIRLYRDVREHWIWSDPEYFRAWIDLIMMTNHEDKKILFNGELITIRRGTFITSIRKLAARWQWSRGRVARFMDTLERDSMIATKRDTQKTLVTLMNYGFYQSGGGKSGTRFKPPIEPQTEPQTEPRVEHNEYTKEYTKESTKKKEDDFVEEYLTEEQLTEEGWK